MNEFWFFSFSSSLICCLRNRTLQVGSRGGGDKNRETVKGAFGASEGPFCRVCILTFARATWLGFHRLGPASAGSWARCSSRTCRCFPSCGPPRVVWTPWSRKKIHVCLDRQKVNLFFEYRWMIKRLVDGLNRYKTNDFHWLLIRKPLF